MGSPSQQINSFSGFTSMNHLGIHTRRRVIINWYTCHPRRWVKYDFIFPWQYLSVTLLGMSPLVCSLLSCPSNPAVFSVCQPLPGPGCVSESQWSCVQTVSRQYCLPLLPSFSILLTIYLFSLSHWSPLRSGWRGKGKKGVGERTETLAHIVT